MALFRPESLRSQDRLHGDVNLAPPTSWQVIGIGIALAFVSAVVFLSLSRYARVATSTGTIESDRGVVHVSTPLGGVIDKVSVKEGQRVRKGQPLLVISHSTDTGAGSLEQKRARAVGAEAAAMEMRAPSLRMASQAKIAAIQAELEGARADQREISAQMEQQSQLIAAAEQDMARVREVAKRGFISGRDVRIREETLASRRQGMSRYIQSRAAARATEAAATQRIQQERADLSSALADMAVARASIEGRAAADDVASTTTVTATTSGVVSGTAVPGQAVAGGQSIMDVVPTGGRLRVRLKLPAEAVAMVAPGQSARVAIDAFPYQTYGTLTARIEQVSSAVVGSGEESGFVAIASLSADAVQAYGVKRPVRPGMAVTARIRTMDRTLLQWLLDPLYAVSRR